MELIDRVELKNIVKLDDYGITWDADAVVQLLESAPVIDAVPVVRCINCIHRICDEYDGDYDRYRCPKTGLNYGPFFFCAAGARMVGDEE